MKILVLGLGKSGTTAMTFKLAGGLPNCHAFSGGKPGRYRRIMKGILGAYENAVYKHTYEPRKGKNFELYKEHLRREHYDRKIWMARDPRDAAVSKMLYRWHKGMGGRKDQFQTHLELVLRKEKDPRSMPFIEILKYTGYKGRVTTSEDIVQEERVRYQDMCNFVKSLGDDWFLFTYENMVSNNYDALNQYLGFILQADAEVPKQTGKAKVVRKKASGDWRLWFTEEDVELFKPAYLPYMETIGYDCEDWALDPNPVIEPEYSSGYMQRLAQNARKNTLLSVKDKLFKRLLR
jgi:hypothetical protein